MVQKGCDHSFRPRLHPYGEPPAWIVITASSEFNVHTNLFTLLDMLPPCEPQSTLVPKLICLDRYSDSQFEYQSGSDRSSFVFSYRYEIRSKSMNVMTFWTCSQLMRLKSDLARIRKLRTPSIPAAQAFEDIPYGSATAFPHRSLARLQGASWVGGTSTKDKWFF